MTSEKFSLLSILTVGILLTVLWRDNAYGKDLFNAFPNAKNSIGIEKLTEEERANLVDILTRIESIAARNCALNLEAIGGNVYNSCASECPS